MPVHAQRMSSLLAADREFAFCRVERRAHAMRGERAWGDGSGLKAVADRARAERTVNMSPMYALDVSKLSAWLNASADCRVEKRACDVGRGTAREVCEGVGR